MHFFAQEYSKALGRTITFQDIPVEPWRDDLLKRGWPVHLVNHLAALGDLHRAGRFDRTSDDVRTLTGQEPLSVQEATGETESLFFFLEGTLGCLLGLPALPLLPPAIPAVLRCSQAEED